MKLSYVSELLIPTLLLLVVACNRGEPKISDSMAHNSQPPNETQIKPTATPKQPRPTPTRITTHIPSLGKPPPSFTPTNFLTSVDFGIFPSELQSTFRSAVDVEFESAPQKAGISVAVYTDDTMWTYATGQADDNIVMSAETPLLISSTSKTFLSALVLKQIENGLYELTDSLETLLPNHPDSPSFAPDKINPEVTILELLTMSSGLSDFSENIAGKSESFKQPLWTPSDTIGLVQSEFGPAGNFQYNDTNVVLLGLIAEIYSGQPLAKLYRETFFTPLGITAITLPEEGIAWHPKLFTDHGDQLTVPNMAMPYTDLSPWSSGFGNMVKAAPFEFGYYIGAVGRLRYACCGIVSTPANVARWAYELYNPNGSVLSESNRNQLLNSFSNKRVPSWSSKNSGESYGYLSAKRIFHLSDGTQVTGYGHPGGGGGYHSLMRYSPELDLSVSILANSEMKFRGTCGGEKIANCIALAIFSAYSDNLKSTSR